MYFIDETNSSTQPYVDNQIVYTCIRTLTVDIEPFSTTCFPIKYAIRNAKVYLF